MTSISDLEWYNRIADNAFQGKIYCHCVYEWKDEIKKLGFKWDGHIKLWYIPKKDFNKALYDKSKKQVSMKNKTTGEAYERPITSYLTEEEVVDRIRNQAQLKSDLATLYGNSMAELGRREEIKSGKKILFKKKTNEKEPNVFDE